MIFSSLLLGCHYLALNLTSDPARLSTVPFGQPVIHSESPPTPTPSPIPTTINIQEGPPPSSDNFTTPIQATLVHLL